MKTTEATGELFSVAPPPGTVMINTHCSVQTREAMRAVMVHGIPILQYEIGDDTTESLAIVNLVNQGFAYQKDVARAFGCSRRTVRRYQSRFDEGGLAALGRPSGYPKGRSRKSAASSRNLLRLKAKGWSNRRIAGRLSVCEKAVRKRLRRLGWKQPEPVQPLLPFDDPSPAAPDVGPVSADPKLSAPALMPEVSNDLAAPATADLNMSAFSEAELPLSLDTNPTDRSADRMLAVMGLLEDAAPLFGSADRVPGAGVLLALPALLSSQVLECAQNIYHSLGPAFFGLRTTILSLLLMALSRIRRPEGLKEHPPQNLGRILGLDRAPEVKTVRRKLSRLAALGRAAAFGRALARVRVAARGEAMGFLYLDGHVRIYHGKHRIPKTHAARMRMLMPGTTDYWMNDMRGDPLFVVTAEANANMVKMMPPLLSELRPLVGKRQLTIVFDRGGWSPKLFVRIIAEGFDLLTYRKGRIPPISKTCFREYTDKIDGQLVSYRLADQDMVLSNELRLRQVTRMTEDGHQTPIVTSRWDLSALEVAHRMFDRWQQENFFKYLREEYELDALVEYNVEPDNPAREVPNPEWHAQEARYRGALQLQEALAAQYGEAAFEDSKTGGSSMRSFEKANATLFRQLSEARKHCERLKKKRDVLPRRVPLAQANRGEVVRLATERKHLTNLLKMVAYQAESDLVHLIEPSYRRAQEEGRTLIQSMLASEADLRVTDTELIVLVRPLSSAHRTLVLDTLCQKLNEVPAIFPGTKLRLRFDVAKPQNGRKGDTF